MFKLTDKLKGYARQHLKVADGADDATYEQAVNAALEEGTLSGKQFAELSAERAPSIKSIIASTVAEAVAQATGAGQKKPAFLGNDGASATEAGDRGIAGGALKSRLTPGQAFGQAAQDANDAAGAGNPKAGQVRVKGVHERYEITKKRAVYPEKSWKDTPHLLAGRGGASTIALAPPRAPSPAPTLSAPGRTCHFPQPRV